MPFALPNLPEALYRLNRLWRLIGCATVLPLIVVAFLGLIGFSGIGASLVGLIVLAVVLGALFAGHAVLFPNAVEETLALSLIVTMYALIAGFAGGSVLAWLFFLGFTVWTLMWGQNKINDLFARTTPRQVTLTAKIKVPADLEAAREWFPLAPESVRGQYRGGTPDADGVFPVWMDTPETDMFEGLNTPERPQFESTEAFFEAVDLQPDDPAYEINMALRKEAEEAGLMPIDADAPSFWAVIDVDDEDHQSTRLLTKDADGTWATDATVEQWFKPTTGGCYVTEQEVSHSFPWGHALMMRLQDFQRDGMIHKRDLLTDQLSISLRATHRWSLLLLTGRWFMQRQLNQAEA
jgi:hypothetical protein